jgi:hypothetical protein
VNDAAPVRIVERGCDSRREVNGFVDRQLLLAMQPCAE